MLPIPGFFFFFFFFWEKRIFFSEEIINSNVFLIRFSEQHVEQRSVSKTIVETKMTSNESMVINGSTVKESKQHQHNHNSTLVEESSGVSPMRQAPSPPMRQYSAETRQQRSTASTSIRYPASSATQELDDLMTSLNTFKIKEGAAEEPVSTTLDDMLGNLQVRVAISRKNNGLLKKNLLFFETRTKYPLFSYVS